MHIVILTVIATFVMQQDVIVVSYPSDFYHKTKVLATSRVALKQQGIVGLSQAPCLKGLLTSLPLILQEQYLYEKVNNLLNGLP
jgi:hypothetical protein